MKNSSNKFHGKNNKDYKKIQILLITQKIQIIQKKMIDFSTLPLKIRKLKI